MNQRIRELKKLASTTRYTGHGEIDELDTELFAKLIVRECKENFVKVWYEHGLDHRGAEIDKFMTQFDEHFEDSE